MLGEMPFFTLQNRSKIGAASGLFFLATLSVLSGCAKEKSNEPPTPKVTERSTVLVGSLTENVTAIHKEAAYQDPCEEQFRDAQLEIAKVLDAKASEITAFTKKKSENTAASYRRVRLGSIQVRELVNPVSPKPGWQSYRTTWKTILEEYHAIKGTPVNDYWVQLNADVRGILLDDVDRVVHSYNTYLDKDAGPKIERMAAAIQKCINLQGCVSIDWPIDVSDFLAQQPYYGSYQRGIERKETVAEKRAMMQRFLSYALGDLKNYRFDPTPKMQRMSAGRYSLQVDPGPLEEVSDQLRGYIESVWRSSQEQVSIKWKDARTASDIYRILIGATVGDRAFVTRGNKTITLFSDVRAKSIAHEFGHVMGFNDRYFTVWHPESCEYLIQYNAEDIMSDPSTGVVLKEHWDDLARYY